MSATVSSTARILRLLTIASLGAGALASCGGGERPVFSSAAPCESTSGLSVVLVVADTLRADFLGSYGFDGPISETWDSLAAEAVQFSSAYAQAPWTKPSVASLMTGQFPDFHGLTNHDGLYAGDRGPTTEVLHSDLRTLAEIAHDSGYATAGFVSNAWLAEDYGFAQGFEHYDTSFASQTTEGTIVSKKALDWLATVDSAEPVFLYVHYMDVHGPYLAREELVERLRGSPSLGRAFDLSTAELSRVPSYLRSPWARGPRGRDITEWRARYGAGVTEFDEALEELVDGLRRAGRLETSVLVLTSDHGEELGEHGGWDHGFNLFQHQLHVPLLFRFPDRAVGGRTISDDVQLVDVLPTVVDLIGGSPVETPGRSLIPLMCGPASPPRPAFATAAKQRPTGHAVIQDGWKMLIDTATGQEQLFSLRDDPKETMPIFELEASPAASIRALLSEHLRESTSNLINETAPVSEETRKRLEALGYVN